MMRSHHTVGTRDASHGVLKMRPSRGKICLVGMNESKQTPYRRFFTSCVGQPIAQRELGIPFGAFGRWDDEGRLPRSPSKPQRGRK